MSEGKMERKKAGIGSRTEKTTVVQEKEEMRGMRKMRNGRSWRQK